MNDRLQIARMLREDLIGELQAINQYELHAAQSTDPQIQELWMHIARDEKEHVVELLQAINRLDTQQAELFQRPPHN